MIWINYTQKQAILECSTIRRNINKKVYSEANYLKRDTSSKEFQNL